MSDYAAYHADRLQLERRIDELLLTSLVRPLTDDEEAELRAACGIPARKEIA